MMKRIKWGIGVFAFAIYAIGGFGAQRARQDAMSDRQSVEDLPICDETSSSAKRFYSASHWSSVLDLIDDIKYPLTRTFPPGNNIAASTCPSTQGIDPQSLSQDDRDTLVRALHFENINRRYLFWLII